jgi:VIT1/CCC1 family predicted Fe2+/Mn2+ transporter
MSNSPGSVSFHLHPKHTETHFTAGATVRDVVIGMSDGLTVPFALAAGISGAVANSHLVVAAGLAEIAAGSIAMGLGGFLAARGDSDHYHREQRREIDEVQKVPDVEEAEVVDLLAQFGVTNEESAPVVVALKRSPEAWVRFMMKFELGLEKPDRRRAYFSAFTIGASYIVGGLVPLAPYIFLKSARTALLASVVMTLIALFVFGLVKGRFTGAVAWQSAVQTVLIGGVAAAAAFALASVFA